MSLTAAWKAASAPPAFSLPSFVAGTVATRTVTRTLASVVPPSPLATRWKLVELAGETVCVPLTATSPMPSMETEVALVVRQLRTTDWPWSMAWGSAVILAVGAGAEVDGGSAEGGGRVLAFLWQPVAASRAMDALKRIVVSLFVAGVCREIILVLV